MENSYNGRENFPQSRTSVIVRKSSEEALHGQSRSQQWGVHPYYAAQGPAPEQGLQGTMLSPPVNSFATRFPSVLPNQRSPHFNQINHYSRRNDDRLTFHSYQNYNAAPYQSSSRLSGGYTPSPSSSNTLPNEQPDPNPQRWGYNHPQNAYNMNRDSQKISSPREAEHHSYSPAPFADNNEPSAPPTPPLDLPEDINLTDFEDRLAKPSAFLRKFATESLKALGVDHNNQSASKPYKVNEDTNLRIDIDDIFSKFSHLANYSNPNVPTSQEQTLENTALLSDGSLSPALEEVESPTDSDKFFNTSTYNDSARVNDKNEHYQPNDELKTSELNENKQNCRANIEYQERRHHEERKTFVDNNDIEQNNESVKDEKRPVSDCHVCGDRAIAHMHYGGICCYSCKAFFRRAVQNGKDKTYKCKKDSDCEVSVNTRRGCQKCRFEKCLEIGMTASWVLSDEQCEIRFGKGKLKRKPDKSSDALKEEVSITKVGGNKVNSLCTQYPFTKDDQMTLVHLMSVYEASKEMIHFSDENIFLWNKVFGKSEYSANEMNSLVATVIKKNIFMMGDNPFFKNMTFDDRRKLLFKNMTEMCHIRGSLRFNASNKSFQWYYTAKDRQQNASPQKKDIGEDAIKNLYNSEEAARDIMNIMQRIASHHLPTEVILILMYVVVFSGDGLQLDNPTYIQDTQTHYLSLVFRYLVNNLPPEDVHRNFSKVMAVLVEVRESGDRTNQHKLRSAVCGSPEYTSSSSSDQN